MRFHDTHTSLYITISEENKRAWLKIEDGVRLALEAIQIVEEEHARIETEEESCLVEEEYARLEARLKAEEEEKDLRLNAEYEARLAEEASLKAEEEDQARLRDDKEACLAKEARRKA